MASKDVLTVTPNSDSFTYSFVLDVLAYFLTVSGVYTIIATTSFDEDPFLLLRVFLMLLVLGLFFAHIASRRARFDHITFHSDRIDYLSGRIAKESRSVIRPKFFSYDNVREVVVSRRPSDFLFGTGTITLPMEGVTRRRDAVTVLHVKNPFAVRAQIERLLAERAKTPSSAQKSRTGAPLISKGS